MKRLFFVGLVATSFSVYGSEVDQLREELKKQQETIKHLQERIKNLESQQQLAEKTKQKLDGIGDSKIDKLLSNPFSQSKFVPDISLILDFSYVSRNLTDSTYKNSEIPGFVHGMAHGDSHSHLPYNFERGLNLNYGEMYISHTVDPYFDLLGVFHLTEYGFEIEEGYFRTRGLPYRLQLKGGKFYSKFGRLNEKHHHFWDFADAPLIYKAVFGEHNLLEKGVQITWLAPTPFYLLVGGEVFQGDNEYNFNRNGFVLNTKRDKSGDDITISDTKKPNVYTLFIKPSFDIGKATILGGFSYAEGRTRINHLEDETPHALSGKTKIYGVDLTVRYDIDSYRYVKLESEWISRNFDGKEFGYNNNGDLEVSSLKKKQTGFYTQLVYKFDTRWRVGARYDVINKNDVILNGDKLHKPDNLYRYSTMVDFLPSEFSRIRLQYNHDRSLFVEDSRKTNHEIILQFNMAIGGHGAHNF